MTVMTKRIDMGTEYAQDGQMIQAVTDMVSNEEYTEFGPIREQELVFQVAAMVKMGTDDEAVATTGEPIIVRRIGPADAVFMPGHFKVYICKTRWDEANELQQKAMLHRALMKVNIEKKEESIKIGLRKPDVWTFQQTIVRFGAWEDELIQLRNNLQAAKKAAAETANSK